MTVWGVGCHPGLASAQEEFDRKRFSSLIRTTPFVSEVGLDRRSKVPMLTQEKTFRVILQELTQSPRIASIHNSGACHLVLELLEEVPIKGVVLHWWRGTPAQTDRAVALGCWFSINAAGMKYTADVARIPRDRILTETDHPSGDRSAPAPRQPGAVADVETALARVYGTPSADVRRQVWRNFKTLAEEVDVVELLSPPIRRMIAVA
ncbi:TatD family hydrolase [Microbacterium aoyamense]|uniref:TatD family hydrolase n=1 Tax=Microbacterium aoyamense TaxID=344166 RepID=A0ABN2P8N9_9MICO